MPIAPVQFSAGALLNLLITLEAAIVPLPKLIKAAAELGVDDAALAAALVEAQTTGTVAIWETALDGPQVHLTSLGAEIAGVKLSDDERPRWIPADADPMVLPFRRPNPRCLRTGDFNEIALANLPARPVPEHGDHDGADHVVYGLRCQWPIPGMETVAPSLDPIPLVCPGCGGRELYGRECCVACDRTALERMVGYAKSPKERGRRRYAPSGGLKGGVG